MSKVYSFRLDENNPREAQAREVIEAWVGEGYAIRYLITEALVAYSTKDKNGNGLEEILEQLSLIILNMQDPNIGKHESSKVKFALSSSFTQAIRSSVKSGVRSD